MSVHKNTGREQDSGKGCATIENNYCLKKWNFFFKKRRKNLMQTCFKTWCPRGKCSGRRCESFQTVKTSLSLTISEIMIMCAAVGWIFTIQTSAASGSPGSICCLNTAATLHTPHHITIYNSTQTQWDGAFLYLGEKTNVQPEKLRNYSNLKLYLHARTLLPILMTLFQYSSTAVEFTSGLNTFPKPRLDNFQFSLLKEAKPFDAGLFFFLLLLVIWIVFCPAFMTSEFLI